MRAYADSGFILRLVTGEADSPQAIAEYRRLDSPRLFYQPLHALEVRNAILQRAFHQRRSIASRQRQHVARERDAALARLEHLVACRALLDVALDMDAALTRAWAHERLTSSTWPAHSRSKANSSSPPTRARRNLPKRKG